MFSKSQAGAELNNDSYFRNGGNVENFRNVGTDITSSFLPFRNHNLELILMMMGISGMVGMSGMLGMIEMLIISGQTSGVKPFWNPKLQQI